MKQGRPRSRCHPGALTGRAQGASSRRPPAPWLERVPGVHRHLLQEEIRLGLEEGGEGAPAPEMHADVLEPLVQAANDVEDKSAVGDDLAQGAELLHLLQLLAIISDG